jgi:hypothetical protein
MNVNDPPHDPNRSPGAAPGDETVAGSLKGSAEEIGERAKSAGQTIAHEAKERAFGAAEEGKSHAAERVDHLASALNASAAELQGREEWLAKGMSSAAHYLEDVSTHLRNQDLEGIAREVSGYARRHPGIFLFGAAALGFGLARVARASRERSYIGSAETPSGMPRGEVHRSDPPASRPSSPQWPPETPI